MPDTTKIYNILKNNEYSVSVFCDKEGLIKVRYPERKQIPFFKPFDAYYKFSKNKKNDENCEGVEFQINLPKGDNPDGYFLDCPKYSFDSIVFSDIKIVCAYIRYSMNLVFFEVESNEKSIDEFLDEVLKKSKLTRAEKNKREKLIEIIEVAEQDGFNQYLREESRESGVEEGYSAIESMYFN